MAEEVGTEPPFCWKSMEGCCCTRKFWWQERLNDEEGRSKLIISYIMPVELKCSEGLINCLTIEFYPQYKPLPDYHDNASKIEFRTPGSVCGGLMEDRTISKSIRLKYISCSTPSVSLSDGIPSKLAPSRRSMNDSLA